MKPHWSGVTTNESDVCHRCAHTYRPRYARRVTSFLIPARFVPIALWSLSQPAYRSGILNSATVHSRARSTYVAADYTALPSAWGNCKTSHAQLAPTPNTRLTHCDISKTRKRNTTISHVLDLWCRKIFWRFEYPTNLQKPKKTTCRRSNLKCLRIQTSNSVKLSSGWNISHICVRIFMREQGTRVEMKTLFLRHIYPINLSAIDQSTNNALGEERQTYLQLREQIHIVNMKTKNASWWSLKIFIAFSSEGISP